MACDKMLTKGFVKSLVVTKVPGVTSAVVSVAVLAVLCFSVCLLFASVTSCNDPLWPLLLLLHSAYHSTPLLLSGYIWRWALTTTTTSWVRYLEENRLLCTVVFSPNEGVH